MELVDLLNSAMGFIDDRASLDQVESAVEAIYEKYQSEFFPFEVKQSGGGWQFLTKPAYFQTIAQINGEKFLKRLSTAALETLSIIAYKQPVTKGEIETIRGVNCDYAVQKLLEKELVTIIGRRENAPGQPLIYATSKTFMDYFGINSTADLPRLNDILVNQAFSPTPMGPDGQTEKLEEDQPTTTLVVNNQGNMEEMAEALPGTNPDLEDEFDAAGDAAATIGAERSIENNEPVQLEEITEDQPISDTENEDELDAAADAAATIDADISIEIGEAPAVVLTNMEDEFDAAADAAATIDAELAIEMEEAITGEAVIASDYETSNTDEINSNTETNFEAIDSDDATDKRKKDPQAGEQTAAD